MVQPLDDERLRRALDVLAGSDIDLAQALERLGYPSSRQRSRALPPSSTSSPPSRSRPHRPPPSAASWRQPWGVRSRPKGCCSSTTRPCVPSASAGPKAAYARGLAQALLAGDLDLAGLQHLEEEAAIASLTRLKGFGRWSAEIYLLFAHGRVDVFPADDLAMQIAFQRLKRLEARPTGRALRALVEPWRPFRGAAAVFLWHYYGAATLDGTG